MSEGVYIFDEITANQSDISRLLSAYQTSYYPAARARGMKLEGAWCSPPVMLPDREMTLHFLWSVPSVPAWWAMRLGAARANPDLDVPLTGDDEKTRFWAMIDDIATSRKRTFMLDSLETASA